MNITKKILFLFMLINLFSLNCQIERVHKKMEEKEDKSFFERFLIELSE